MAHPALRIGVLELRRRPGTQRDVHIATALPGLQITGARVPEGAELVLDATLESIEGAITVTGTVEVPWTAECRRCLEEIVGVAVVDVREVFEAQPIEGDTYPIDGDEVDLEPVVRDAALLHLPLAPLCREGCAGPAPAEFPARVEGDDEGGETEPERDPRWAALDELRLDADS
jgi:uncharacterized protein